MPTRSTHTGNPDHAGQRWAHLGRTAWTVLFVHVAALLALVLVAANQGAWILDGDAAYSRCARLGQRLGYGHVAATDHRFTTRPLTLECSYPPTGPEPGRDVIIHEASNLQTVGFMGVVASLVVVPLSWFVLLLVTIVSAWRAAAGRLRARSTDGP